MPGVAAARYLPTTLLVAVLGCDVVYTADRPEADPNVSVVHAITVLPRYVFVTPGDVFVMEARMLDRDNGALPEHPQLTWKLGASLTEIARGRDSIVLKAAATSGTTSLKAAVGERESSAEIVILPAAAGTRDTVWTEYASGHAPDAVLLDDTLASAPIDDSLVSLVQVGLLGNLAGGFGDLARFSRHQSFQLRRVRWKEARNVVDFRTGDEFVDSDSDWSLPLRHSYTIWLASNALDGLATAEDDAQYALGVLRRQRTGLALQHIVRDAGGAGTFTIEIDETTQDCIWVPQRLYDLGVPSTGATFAPESLNVVYVDEILRTGLEGEVDVPTRLAGFSCNWDPSIGSVIVISRALRSGGTLIHELGHALGLREPYSGHTLLAEGFSYTNLMWPYESDAGTAPRSTLSLGQAFRINLDKRSWLRMLTGVSRWCDPLSIDRSCPALERDLAPLP